MANGKSTPLVDGRLPLESVITTSELRRRPRRAPDYKGENQVLVSLAAEMAGTPGNVLQKLAESALRLCRAQSAGISILEEHDGQRMVRWQAAAGRWAGYLGRVMPREISPCGTVLDRNASLLMSRPERHFPFPPEVTPGIEEVLLAPFHVAGKPIGTIWVIAHDGTRRFDEEDDRLLLSLAQFASSAYQVLGSLEALRESEQRFRQIIDSMPAAVYTTDAEGLLTHFNAAAVECVGRQPQMGIDQWCVSWKLLRADGTPLPHAECPMAVSLKEARPIRGEKLIIERPDGKRAWVLPHPTPIFDERGKLTGGVNMVLDITSLKEAEESLREANRRKDEFLAILAHELRNPLAPVYNAALYLKLQDFPDPELKHSIGMIERQVVHMARLIDDLLDVSRISRGVLDLRLERLNFDEIAEAAVEACRDEIKARGHSLHVDLPRASVWVLADRHRLVQVFCNLLTNAAKYTPLGGRIELAVKVREDRTFEAVVADNGIGIPAAKLSEIFELFARVDPSLEGQGGLGIGLTLALQIIELHHGTIEARSDGAGQGASFLVRLPLASAAEIAPSEIEPGPRNEPRRILVVDDNQDAAESLFLLLKSAGHSVQVAFDGDAALRIAAQFEPELVFLDIGMPKTNGYDAARRMRAESWGKSIHLVALTGWGQEDDRRRAEEAGFNAHLVKPVSPEALRQQIATLPSAR
jgi:PAS domain S-box-containing protein